VDSDLRDVTKVLTGAAETLDFGKPVAVTVTMTLHAISDQDDPHAIVARFMNEMPPGRQWRPASQVQEIFSVWAGVARK
jgi:hypothetical protein